MLKFRNYKNLAFFSFIKGKIGNKSFNILNDLMFLILSFFSLIIFDYLMSTGSLYGIDVKIIIGIIGIIFLLVMSYLIFYNLISLILIKTFSKKNIDISAYSSYPFFNYIDRMKGIGEFGFIRPRIYVINIIMYSSIFLLVLVVFFYILI